MEISWTNVFASEGSRTDLTSTWTSGWATIVIATGGIPVTQQFNMFGYYLDSKCNTLKTLADAKVDKVTGKELSTNDFTNAYKAILDNLSTNYAAKDHTHSGYAAADHTHSGYATLDSYSKVTATQAAARIVSVTSSKTLSASDCGTFQYVDSSSAIEITIASASALPIGTEIEVFRAGAGSVSIKTSGQLRLNGDYSTTKTIASRYSAVILKRVNDRGTYQDWVAVGDI